YGRHRGDRPPAFGEPIPGLTAQQADLFADGKADFAEVESVADGLGPVFNGRSCAECHSVPAVGGGSERTVTRFGKRHDGTAGRVNMVFNPATGTTTVGKF